MLMDIFHSNSIIKTLDFLLDYREYDYTKEEIAENSGVPLSTLYEVFPKLEKLGIVHKTNNKGKVQLYKLNKKSDLVKALIKFDNELTSLLVDLELEKQEKEEMVKSSIIDN